MTQKVIANYVDEQAAIQSLWQSSCSHRIVLLKGDSGCGKSTLVSFAAQTMPHDELHWIPIQLKGSTVNVAEIFAQSVQIVGYKAFPNFQKEVKRLRGIKVEVNDTTIHGDHNEVSAALHVDSVAEQKRRRDRLTSAWFEDVTKLRRKKPIILGLDTYEQASEDIKDWIAHVFLPRASRLKRIRILLAGQEVPDVQAGIAWNHCCKPFEMYGIDKAEKWLPVIEAEERILPDHLGLKWLAGVCFALNGRPAEILAIISTLPKRIQLQ